MSDPDQPYLVEVGLISCRRNYPAHMTIAVFLLALGATARITRFLNVDYLARGIRVLIIKRFGPDHDLAYGIACPWCLSVWAAGGVYTVAYFYGHTGAFVITAGALTASWVYAIVAKFADPIDDEDDDDA